MNWVVLMCCSPTTLSPIFNQETVDRCFDPLCIAIDTNLARFTERPSSNMKGSPYQGPLEAWKSAKPLSINFQEATTARRLARRLWNWLFWSESATSKGGPTNERLLVSELENGRLAMLSACADDLARSRMEAIARNLQYPEMIRQPLGL